MTVDIITLAVKSLCMLSSVNLAFWASSRASSLLPNVFSVFLKVLDLCGRFSPLSMGRASRPYDRVCAGCSVGLQIL